MMNKRNKIIFIGLFFALVLVLGIYLFPKDKMTERTASKPSSRNVLNEDFEREATPVAPSKSDASLSVPAKNLSSKTNPYVFYPDSLMGLLGIDMAKVIAERDKFKNSVVHVEWMDHLNDVLKNLDPEKKEAIIENHATLLYIKDLLNQAYLSGKIDHDTFIKAVADLMKWNQKTYESILSEAEYEAVFEVKPEAAGEMIDDMMQSAPRYSFILNQKIPAEEVTKEVQGYKLEEVDSHFKKMILEREQIGKKINSGEMTLEQAREALQKSQQAFIAKCKELLTKDEINTIFGSVEALETGGTQTRPPAVLGDSDREELGFEIENPDTTIKAVKEKIDKNKLEDIKFFYQQRDKERKQLIDKLDAGEIKSDEVENVSNDLDTTFKENCRSVLTDAEYNLIFENPENIETVSPGNENVESAEGAGPEDSATSGEVSQEPEKTQAQ